MDEQKSTGILPSLEALVDKRAIRQRKQREYYAEKGKEVRRKYYLANIEECELTLGSPRCFYGGWSLR